MTRFRAWADGSVARLDVNDRGLGLALMDPDGQVAAVFVDGWRSMHSTYSGIRGYARFALSDGSMGDAEVKLGAPADRDGKDEIRVQVEDLGNGATRTTTTTGSGGGHGGTTKVVENDGHGKVSTTDIDAVGSTTETIEQTGSDGTTHFTTDISRRDGTSTRVSGDFDNQGLGGSQTTEFDSHGNETSKTWKSDFHQGGDTVHKSVTTLPSGETESHTDTMHSDGTRFREDIRADRSGAVTSQETDYTWPNHEAKTSLNPDGTTNVTNKTTEHDLVHNETHITESIEKRDANGRQVGDATTEETILHYGDETTFTVIVTVEHTDGSSQVTTKEFDENGVQTSETTEPHPPPDVVGPPEGSKGPDSKGPDSKGPDSKGPDSKGPDSKGPDSKGPDSKGPDSKGPDGATGRRSGGITIDGLPCDPTRDFDCFPVVVKARQDSRGAIGLEIDVLQQLFASGASRLGPDDLAVITHRLAQDIFGELGAPNNLQGSSLAVELESASRQSDADWDHLDRPGMLAASLTRISKGLRY